MTSIVNNIDTVAAAKCRIRFEAIDNKTICMVDVEPSTRPVFANTDKGKSVFFIRTGNATRAIEGEEILTYTQDRFGVSNS